jgi:rhodanese-related sulfurtransferase
MTGEANAGYAGDLTVEEAVERVRAGAVLVDIRSEREWHQVGVPVTEALGAPAGGPSLLPSTPVQQVSPPTASSAASRHRAAGRTER